MNMNSKYIIRLDDACPTNNLDKWNSVESVLDTCAIKPIVCVVPDNRDQGLHYAPYDDNYWNRVKRWQDKGWYMAMHGCNHTFITKSRGLIPINPYSEFADVAIDLQRKKIRDGYSILLSHGIKPIIWVAPAHSFDKNTLKVLEEETDIRIVSDGLAYFPYSENGFFWIPQQLWGYERKKIGVWTLCTHIDTADGNWMAEQMKIYQKDSDLFNVDIVELLKTYGGRKKKLSDIIFSKTFLLKRFIRCNYIQPIKKSLLNHFF